MSKPVLYVFAISHYCEKARWALEYLGVEYEIRYLAPGIHIKVARKLGAAGTSLPMLPVAGRGLQGSAGGMGGGEYESDGLGAIGRAAPGKGVRSIVAVAGIPGGDPAAFLEGACGEFETAGASSGRNARDFPGVVGIASRGCDKDQAGQDGHMTHGGVRLNPWLLSWAAWLAQPPASACRNLSRSPQGAQRAG